MKTIVLILKLILWLIEPVTTTVCRAGSWIHHAATADIAPFLRWLGLCLFKITCFCVAAVFIGFQLTVCLYIGIVVVHWAVRLLKAVERSPQR